MILPSYWQYLGPVGRTLYANGLTGNNARVYFHLFHEYRVALQLQMELFVAFEPCVEGFVPKQMTINSTQKGIEVETMTFLLGKLC